MIKKIPIVILTKDEPRFLELMIKSIVKRTNYPYKIFIVDNNSETESQKKLLNKLNNDTLNLEVIFNKKNEWVLGFNKAFEYIKCDPLINYKYSILSDGDIIVPIPKEGVCWLGYLKKKIDENIIAGKIGLSLDLGFIKNKKLFEETYSREKKYVNGPRISDLTIAPVDTTLAIYRADIFITKEFKIMPGHSSLIKPCYYTFRTKDMSCKHLGWRSYEVSKEPHILEKKILCFTKYSGYIDPVVLQKVRLKVRLYYYFFRRCYKLLWGIKVVFYWIKYLSKNFPQNINEIRSKYK